MTDAYDSTDRNCAIVWLVVGIVVFLGTMGGVLGYAVTHKVSDMVKHPKDLKNLESCVEVQWWSREAKDHPKEALPLKSKGKDPNLKGHEWPPPDITADSLKEVKGSPTTVGPYASFLFEKAADNCFCERIRDGYIPQPASTWSTLGFPLVGLACLIHMVLERGRPGYTARRKNAMTTSTFFAGCYAIVVILMGPGSMCLHATMNQIGGYMDLLSLVAFSSFIVAYDISGVIEKLAGLARGWRMFFFLLVFSGFGILMAYLIYHEKFNVLDKDGNHVGKPTIYFILSGVGAGVLDMFVILRLFRRNRFFFWGGGRLFSLAFVVWLCSRGIIPLCNPDTFFQWHAWWHIIAALFTGWIYLYLRTEEETVPPVGAPT